MKSIGLAATYGFLVLIILVACNPASDQHSAGQSNTRTETAPLEESTKPMSDGIPSRDRIPDLRHMPLYPGAQHIQVEVHESPPWSSTSFDTLDSSEKVVTYYKEELPKQGWARSSGSENDYGLSFL